MGSAGDSYKLISLPGKEQAPDEDVRRTLVETLAEVWSDFLPYAFRELATSWILLGQDSLLTVEVGGGQVIFWFYESVGWSEGLAMHWLDLALSARRRDFELALEGVGYGIDPSDWPHLSEVEGGATRLFFASGGDIGQAMTDTRTVEWQLKDYGKEYEAPSTPFDDLDPAARERVEAVIARGRCACPVCEARFGTAKIGPFEAGPEHEIRREALFLAKEIPVAARVGERWVVVASSRAHASWGLVGEALGGRLGSIGALSDRRRGVDHLAIAGSRAVAQIGSSGAGERLFSLSEDGGKTWSPRAQVAGLPALKRARFFDGDAEGEVLCAGYPSNEVYRSKDGGASFEVLAKAPALEGDPIRYFRGLARAGDWLFAIVETKAKKKGIRLCRSADRGVTFQDIDVPGLAGPRALALLGPRGASAVGCIGEGGFARSTDGGATWALSPIGPGAPIAIASGTNGILLATEAPEAAVHVSEDGGQTWRIAARCAAGGVFADPTGASLGLFAVEGVLCSVRRRAPLTKA